MKQFLFSLIILFLSTASTAFSQALPAGSYWDSCTSCQIWNHSLRCMCKTVNGNSNKTSINMKSCKSTISNINGYLSCDLPHPTGSYKGSCRYCRISDGYFFCQCKTRGGIWKNTSIRLGACTGSMSNIDGHLTCD